VILAAASLSYAVVLPIALFGAFAALAWFLLDWLSSHKPRALERLDELKNPRKREASILDNKGPTKRSDAVGKVLEKASPLARPLEPKSEEELGRLRARLACAGFRSDGASKIFLGLKFLGLLSGLVIGAGTFIPLNGLTQRALLSIGFSAALLFYVPDLVVWYLGLNRKLSIFLGLPDGLDLMVVCVEAGLGLDQAMRKVADEMAHSYPTLSEEFALANFQLQMGRPRSQVLHELGARTGVQDVRTLAGVLIQAERFGSSVAQALRVQSDSMRVRRRQIAEEKAAKTAVKLIFPLVLFIFPGIFVVLVGPAAITMVRQMLPMMGGG
jgi:tight adherence protein C